MLVVSRRASESIRIGPDIVVRVTRVGSGEVWLAFDASPDSPPRAAPPMVTCQPGSIRVGESIRVGPDIVVRVTRARGGQVRLGIDAPPEMRIARG